MPTPKSTPSPLHVLIPFGLIVVCLAVPLALAWLGNRYWSWEADWFGAIGSMAGAAGSTSAIVWAIVLFRQDADEKRETSTRAQEIAQGDANQVEITLGSENHGYGGRLFLRSAHITVKNTSLQPIYLRKVSLSGGPSDAITIPDVLEWTGKERHLLPGAKVEFPRIHRGQEYEVDPGASASQLGFLGDIEFQQGPRYWRKTTQSSDARELGAD